MTTTKKAWQPIIDKLYARVFSELNKKKFEKVTLYLSIVGFILHLMLIYAKKLELVVFSFDTPLLDNPISAIYTPFTVILIYEIYLLVLNLPRSFTTSVSKQFEIISLILIRRLFADIPKVDLSANWFSTKENLELIYNILGVLILYYLIFLFNKARHKLEKKPLTDVISRFITSKKGVSLVLLFVLIVLSFTSAYNWGKDLLLNDSSGDINSVFYNEFFSVLILADVLILLLSFQYTERYSQIVRNTGFIISTVLIRLSFGVTGLANISLVVSSVVFGLIILWVYNLTEKERRRRTNVI